MSEWKEQGQLAAELQAAGVAVREVADRLRARYGINARQAWRVVRRMSQRDVAERWSLRWPDDPKQSKRISLWETWPAGRGHMPPLDQLDKLAQLYECSVADLLVDFGDHRRADAGQTPIASPETLPHYRAEPDEVPRSEAPDGWYVESFEALLRLDLATPMAIERRTIVSTIDGLTELDTRISVPRHPDDHHQGHALDADLLFGGTLRTREQPNESVFRHVIELASPLGRLTRHEYMMQLTIPPGQSMAPHYVHVPLQRSNHFRLVVRFSIAKPPQVVWTLNETPPAAIYDRRPTDDLVQVDRFGETIVEFHNLRVGHGYGICWIN